MDVRLTMGGEPTFVSIDDMDSAQWNTKALGADKLKLAKDLLISLKDKFSTQALLHYGQGKWYPGEELPRWALGCFWRTDGEALWHDPSLLARVDKDYQHTIEDAESFGLHLCERLGIHTQYLQPAYEDSLYYLWLERSLPESANPKKAKLSDDLERRRLAKLLGRGLESISGYVIPVSFDGQRWRSSLWQMRSDVITLIPGDSPMGYRLPLDSLPHVSEEEVPPERDPFETREALPAYSLTDTVAQRQQPQESPIQDEKSDKKTVDVIRTSICVEPRDGRLHLFLPPVTHLEHYVELIYQIESTAHALSISVVIEGYEPPKDYRLQKFLITPDPGVIEVNIHPSKSWQELVDNTEILYEQAHKCRLGTEKFMLDGRHTGTGGGNHITLGGPTPADSPLLRKPDLYEVWLTTGSTIRGFLTSSPACLSAQRVRHRVQTKAETKPCTRWRSPSRTSRTVWSINRGWPTD